MDKHFTVTIRMAFPAWLCLTTLVTCGITLGESTAKCDIRVWYINKIGEGMFTEELTTEQHTIKTTIENIIQRSSTNPELSNVDCSVLEMYESVFKPGQQNETADFGENPKESEAPEDEEVDETEMADDETETEDEDDTEDAADDGVREDSTDSLVNKTTTKPPFSTLLRKCRKQKSNRTSVSCVFVNTVKFQCMLSEGRYGDEEREIGRKLDSNVSGVQEDVDKQDSSDNGVKLSESEKGKGNQESTERVEETTTEQTKPDGEKQPVHQKPKGKLDEDLAKSQHIKPDTSTTNKDNGDTHETRTGGTDHTPSASKIDMHHFQQLIEKTASEYMLKIQTLETQIMRLENELLMEKLNKQNHTSSFSRLENQILKLENELLKMNLSYDELKEENEKIMKKQKSFLELDYVKRPGDYRALPDKSSKQFELISQHQSKISELTDHLRNQSQLIDKIKGQSDSLEDQNRMLFQIVMNQTMLISQMMKKVESLSDSNMKHQIQQQLLTNKLGVALASGHVMEDLNALVSDKLPQTLKRTVVDENGLDKVPTKPRHRRTHSLTLARCNHPRRNKATCGFNSVVLSQCLWNQNHSAVVVSVSESHVVDQHANKAPKPTNTDNTGSSTVNRENVGEFTTTENGTRDSVQEKKVNSTSNSKPSENSGEKNLQETDKLPEDKPKENGTKTPGTKSEQVDSDPQINKRALTQTEEKKTSTDSTPKTDENKSTDSTPKADGNKSTDSTPKTDGNKSTDSTPKTEGNKSTDSISKTDGNKSTDSISKTEEKTVQNAAPKATESNVNKDVKKVNKETTKDKKAGSEAKKDKKKSTKTDAKKSKAERIPPLYNKTNQIEPKDCSDYYRRGKQKDGQYKIKLHGTKELVSVFCDMKNGGWTVIQRRQDGTVNFFRTWDEYKKGFGGVYGEHWLGNDVIHRLTNQDQYEMRVDLMDWERNKKFALYEYMRVDDEAAGYMLHVDGYSGDAGDGFSKHHGEKFSTKDRDNDRVVKEFDGSCANRFKGAWWYYKCYASNLNGKFYRNGKIPEKQFDGITWKPWTGPNVSLKKVEIKVRSIVKK